MHIDSTLEQQKNKYNHNEFTFQKWKKLMKSFM
jgi:hypothetical protein